MMTLEQYLLGKVSQECAEIAKCASKAQLFGMTASHGGKEYNNAKEMMDEVHDLMAVLKMLGDISALDPHLRSERIPPIIEKIQEYAEHSRRFGKLEPL